jgi:cell division protein FtsW (lipid II flippase)
MLGLSRDETVSIVIIGITVAVFAWYRVDMTGVQRWTNATIVFLVSIAVATAVTAILKRWNPVWYRS